MTNIKNHTGRIVIIGNGEVNKNYSSFIDNSDYIIRFNWLDNYNKNTGIKTDALSLASAVQHIDNYLHPTSDAHKTKFNCFKKILTEIDTLIFPFPDENRLCHLRHKRIDKLINFYHLNNKNIKKYFCEEQYMEDLKKNRWPKNVIAPSSGYTVIRNILDDKSFINHRIYLLGFNWSGWLGHPWSSEKEVLTKLAKQKKIFILSSD